MSWILGALLVTAGAAIFLWLPGELGRRTYRRRLEVYRGEEPADVSDTPDEEGLVKKFQDGTTWIEYPNEQPMIFAAGEVPPSFPSLDVWLLCRALTRLRGLGPETPFLMDMSEMEFADMISSGGIRWEGSEGSPTAVMSRNPCAHLAFLLGSKHSSAKNWAKAEMHYRKALVIDANFAAAYNNLGMVVGASSRDREEEAAALFTKALALVPTYGSALRNLTALSEGHHLDDAYAGRSASTE